MVMGLPSASRLLLTPVSSGCSAGLPAVSAEPPLPAAPPFLALHLHRHRVPAGAPACPLTSSQISLLPLPAPCPARHLVEEGQTREGCSQGSRAKCCRGPTGLHCWLDRDPHLTGFPSFNGLAHKCVWGLGSQYTHSRSPHRTRNIPLLKLSSHIHSHTTFYHFIKVMHSF